MTTVVERIQQIVREAGVPDRNARGTLAKICGISHQAVRDWFEGKTKNIKHEHLVAISDHYGVSLDWLLTGKGRRDPEFISKMVTLGDELPDISFRVVEEQAETVAVPRYEVALSAGPGASVIREDHDSYLHFRRDWLKKKHYEPRKLKALDVNGDSMEPRITDGDIVLIDTGDTAIKDGQVYAIRYGEDVKIKRLSVRYDGSVVLSSDNPAAPGPREEIVPTEELEHLHIIGRAVWVGGDIN